MLVAPSGTPADAGTITPFWLRIPRFFLFPFHTEPLLYMIFLALASPLDLIVPRIFGLSIVEIGIVLAVLRYAFRIVEQTSLGLLTPQEYQLDAALDTVYLPYKMFGILVIWGVVEGITTRFSPTVGVFMRLFTTLALPAVAMVLVMSGSFIDGINPAQWVAVMRAVGMPYLALWIFLFLLLSGAGTALGLLWPVLGGWLTLPIINLANIYFTFVMANMMGYVLYQYHAELGITVKVGFGASRASAADAATDPIGDDIARRVAAGDLKGALEIANEQQQVEPDNLVAHERYHKLLELAGNNEALLRHGPSYIAALLRRDHAYRALGILKSLRSVQPEFESGNPAHALPLARAAQRQGEHEFALALLRGFAQRHPQHADIPAVHLLAAQILSEHLHKDDIARKLLRDLIVKHPQSPASADAATYLQTMDRIASLGVDGAARPPVDGA